MAFDAPSCSCHEIRRKLRHICKIRKADQLTTASVKVLKQGEQQALKREPRPGISMVSCRRWLTRIEISFRRSRSYDVDLPLLLASRIVWDRFSLYGWLAGLRTQLDRFAISAQCSSSKERKKWKKKHIQPDLPLSLLRTTEEGNAKEMQFSLTLSIIFPRNHGEWRLIILSYSCSFCLSFASSDTQDKHVHSSSLIPD